MSIRKTQNNGLTLIELLITFGLIVFIFSAFIVLHNFTLSQQQYALDSFITTETANRAIEKITRELRNGRNGDNGAYLLERVNDQELVFYSDIDRDGQVERVRYFLEGEELVKGVTKPTVYPIQYPTTNEHLDLIADGIQNGTTPLFYYYNGNWPADTVNNPLPLANRLTQTRLIGIKLFTNSNKNIINTDQSFESFVQIRMLKDNL